MAKVQCRYRQSRKIFGVVSKIKNQKSTKDEDPNRKWHRKKNNGEKKTAAAAGGGGAASEKMGGGEEEKRRG